MKRSITYRILSSALIVPALLTSSLPLAAYYHSTGDEYEENPADSWRPLVIKVDDESKVAELEEKGVKILFRRGDILLTLVPRISQETQDGRDDTNGQKLKKKDTQKKSRAIRRLESPRLPGHTDFNTPALSEARRRCGADRVIAGEGFTRPYTGKGVVAGFCDIGFDPMHINFTSSDGKSSRIKKIVQYKEAQGKRIELDTPEEFASWRTDTLDDNHATHVAGIMAGGYSANGYNGIAPDAEIVATTSQLSDVGLLAGVEEIIAYARSVGKPAVINLSMGNYTGPKDGSSLFCQYLDRCADDAIIVLSAGNNGNRTITMQYDFTESKPGMGGRISNNLWDNFDFSGMVDFWSADSRAVTLTPVIYDDAVCQIIHRLPPFTLHDGDIKKYATSGYTDEKDGFEDMGPAFSRCFEGAMIYQGGIDPENGRYNLTWRFDVHTKEVSADGPWARYSIGFELDGAPGQHIDIYPDGIRTFLKQFPGGVLPNHKGGFSDLACGHRTVSVGMSNNRATMHYLDGSSRETGNTPGHINRNSSYGTLIDGRVMPLTVAPGADIISSASLPYIEANNAGDNVNSLRAIVDGKEYFWVENTGTSMSAPYVAGAIATWLEACPYLTSEDVLSIIRKVNRHDFPDQENPRNGQGWFDAAGGLRLALATDVSTALIEESDPLPFRLLTEREGISVINPECKEISVEIYTPDGCLINTISDNSPHIMIPGNDGTRTVRIIKVSSGRHTRVIKTSA